MGVFLNSMSLLLMFWICDVLIYAQSDQYAMKENMSRIMLINDYLSFITA